MLVSGGISEFPPPKGERPCRKSGFAHTFLTFTALLADPVFIVAFLSSQAIKALTPPSGSDAASLFVQPVTLSSSSPPVEHMCQLLKYEEGLSRKPTGRRLVSSSSRSSIVGTDVSQYRFVGIRAGNASSRLFGGCSLATHDEVTIPVSARGALL